jgi:hypothetical protein
MYIHMPEFWTWLSALTPKQYHQNLSILEPTA